MTDYDAKRWADILAPDREGSGEMTDEQKAEVDRWNQLERGAHPVTGDGFAVWSTGIHRCLDCGLVKEPEPAPCPQCGQTECLP